MRPLRIALGAVCLLAAADSIAKADIIPTLVGGAPTLVSAGVYDWTYDVQLTNNEALNSTSTFAQFGTLYDISFLPVDDVTVEAGSILASDFTFSSSLTNTPASDTNPPDNSGIYNLEYLYTPDSGTVVGATTGTGTANVDLGTFSFLSSISGTSLTYYAGEASDSSSGVVSDTEDSNLGQVAGPSALPEPSTLFLLGFGILGLSGLLRRKNKNVQAI